MNTNTLRVSTQRLSVAPMMGHTDRHFRYFLRLLSPSVKLYTEMVTTGALLHGDDNTMLAYHPSEHPLVLQLGGSNPEDLARCAHLAATCGFDEINLNVGCPSPRVQQGRIGACLMAEPELIARCVALMRAAVDIPITVKIRTGIDHLDSYTFLHQFVATVASAGCSEFIVHARKAWLSGLSPRENRNKPPLDYERVYQLKQDFPELKMTINGGITTVTDVKTHLRHVEGVMIGRKAVDDPWFMHTLATMCYPQTTAPLHCPTAIMDQILTYMTEQQRQGVPLWRMVRHLLGFFKGQSGARAWRRSLSEGVRGRSIVSVDVVRHALQHVQI